LTSPIEDIAQTAPIFNLPSTAQIPAGFSHNRWAKLWPLHGESGDKQARFMRGGLVGVVSSPLGGTVGRPWLS